MLLRGHDTFFLWCTSPELATEIKLVHEVYRESLEYNGFIQRGMPVQFGVPSKPGPVVSGLRLGNRVLARRTDFGPKKEDEIMTLADGDKVSVVSKMGMQILDVKQFAHSSGAGAGASSGTGNKTPNCCVRSQQSANAMISRMWRPGVR